MKKHLSPFFPVLVLGFLLSIEIAYSQPKLPNSAPQYAPDAVIFKLLPEHGAAVVQMDHESFQLADDQLKALSDARGTHSVRLLFPHHANRKPGKVDLSLIGALKFNEPINVPMFCRKLMQTRKFEYVEPQWLIKLDDAAEEKCLPLSVNESELNFEPNDPLLNEQWHLGKIKAFDAWEIEKGDTSIMIGIVDSGIDFDHPDLEENIAINYAEIPDNNFDDDGNGLEDDYYGWDFYYNDNDPSHGVPGYFHGTRVAGVASAVTDNGIGLAAPGFKTKVLVVKCTPDSPGSFPLQYGFQGVVYAADRGCKIINCSWGSSIITNCQFCKDAVEYATSNKNALVISSSGNDNSSAFGEPGNLPNVYAIAATNEQDQKKSYSGFGSNIALAAPSNIYSTESGGDYAENVWGTSYSAPLVSGAAAILAAQHPSWSGLQIGERLRVTADNIDSQNPGHIEALGNGRLNMFRALTDPPIPAVRFKNIQISDGEDELFSPGDTIQVWGDFINYLANVGPLEITLSSPNTDITLVNDSYTIDALASLESQSNESEPFSFVINMDAELDLNLSLRLNYQSIGYEDWQWIAGIKANPTTLVLDNHVIATTISSTGRMGYYENYFQGLGLNYHDTTNLEGHFALMLGAEFTPIKVVADAALSSWNNNNSIYSNDFELVQRVIHDPESSSDISLFCSYQHSFLETFPVFVEQKTYAWFDDHFFIAEYDITNTSSTSLEGFYAGLWGEATTGNYAEDVATGDTDLQLIYAYNSFEEYPYVGIQLLSGSSYLPYVYVYSESYEGVNVIDVFSDAEKYRTLEEINNSGGFDESDSDGVGMVIGSGPFEFTPGDRKTFAFAILVADNLQALKDAAIEAQDRYAQLYVNTHEAQPKRMGGLQIRPNPAYSNILIQSEIPIPQDGNLELFTQAGQFVKALYISPDSEVLEMDISDLPKGMYFLRLRTQEEVRTGVFVKQ